MTSMGGKGRRTIVHRLNSRTKELSDAIYAKLEGARNVADLCRLFGLAGESDNRRLQYKPKLQIYGNSAHWRSLFVDQDSPGRSTPGHRCPHAS